MTSTTGPARQVRQEQLPASPDITEVAPGVLRMQLPIFLPGLGHVNCYALEDADGFAVVDPGLPGAEPFADLETRLAAAEIPLRRIHTVVVTHSHPDHFGGARRIQAATGARIVSHESFKSWWDMGDDRELEGRDRVGDGEVVVPRPDGVVDNKTPWGAEFRPPGGGPIRRDAEMVREWRAPDPTDRLAEADAITLAGREWFAVHTPGHTPDHLCLFDPTEGVFLSGDHVLPTITPHISGIGAGEDPLALFFRSLERMHEIPGVTTVLPAHGDPFTDLGGRADEIRDHHVERLEALAQISARIGPANVVELSHELFKPRSWGPMAESETYAHLEHLRLSGRAQRDEVAGLLTYAVS